MHVYVRACVCVFASCARDALLVRCLSYQGILCAHLKLEAYVRFV